ncbi:MAG: hypothetical protein ACYCU7_12785 [Acidimicrobiales bacterium]
MDSGLSALPETTCEVDGRPNRDRISLAGPVARRRQHAGGAIAAATVAVAIGDASFEEQAVSAVRRSPSWPARPSWR